MSVSDSSTPSTRPYMIRAMHEWCCDNGFSPYLAVKVDASVQVPIEFVQDGEIVLNVGVDATSGLRLGNDFIEFKARFGGVAREIVVPVNHVLAIYARENGQGMSFTPPAASVLAGLEAALPGLLDELNASETEDLSEPRGILRVVPSGDASLEAEPGTEDGNAPDPNGPPKGGTGRPVLKRIK